MWLICLTPSAICLPYYLKFLTLWCLWVADLVMRLLDLFLELNYFLCVYMILLHSPVLCDLCPFCVIISASWTKFYTHVYEQVQLHFL
jgi:hypothetical protein